MKYIALFILSFFSIAAVSQSSEISLREKCLIGKITNGKPKLAVNAKELIRKVNKEFYTTEDIIDEAAIIENYTLGGQKIKYYYVEFSSSKRKDLHIVRWLCNYNGELYFDKSNNPDIYTYIDLFIICEGNEKCRPRLFYMGNEELNWSCREFIGCVTEEEAKINKCTQSNSIASDN